MGEYLDLVDYLLIAEAVAGMPVEQIASALPTFGFLQQGGARRAAGAFQSSKIGEITDIPRMHNGHIDLD